MEHTTAAQIEHHDSGTKEIWRTFWILLVLTIVELILGYFMIGKEGGLRLAIKGAIIILMLAKAFYIVAYFMHLKGEIKNLIMTVVVPLSLFFWFIIAFLYDGSSYKHLRNNYDIYHNERGHTKATPQENKVDETTHKKEPAME
jgi:cytochrome c oxidase subunit IV